MTSAPSEGEQTRTPQCTMPTRGILGERMLLKGQKWQGNKISNCQHLLDHWENKRVSEKHLLLLCWLSRSLWLSQQTGKFLKEIGIPGHLTCLLRNQYAGQEAMVRNRHGTMDWFQTGKGVHQACILACLLNLYESSSYEMQVGWAKAGIKIARRNSNNLRYADDSTLMSESKEELKNLWCRLKRRVKKLA